MFAIQQSRPARTWIVIHGPLDPAFLQVVSALLPMTYYVFILRSIVIKGVGLELLIPQTLALIAFSMVLLGVAAMRFRKSLD